jgi:hypothetical protein
MKKPGIFSVVAVIFLFAIPMASGNSRDESPAAVPVATPAPSHPVAAQEREWLIMVFISGVNDRGILGYANDAINKMERVGSADAVAVVVKYGILSIDNPVDRNLVFPRGSKTILVQRDDDLGRVTSPVIHDSKNADMGSWKHMAEFARHSILKFPAKKTMLIVWGRGFGVSGIASDDVSGNKMTIENLGRALAQIHKAAGRKLDVFATDASLMQMAGVIYELKEHSSVIIGSEEIIPDHGYPYDTIFEAVNANPGMDSEMMARTIVARYDTLYTTTRATLSAVRNDRIDGFVRLLNSWTEKIMEAPAALTAAAAAIADTFYFDHGNTESRDLCDYLDRVSAALPADSPAVAAGRELKNYIKRDLLIVHESGMSRHEESTLSYTERTHGLAIYIPNLRYDSATYETLAFVKGSQWDEFLLALMTEKLKGNKK